MSVLIGIELRGSRSVLTVVDRRGDVLAVWEGQLETSIEDWFRVHPEGYYRGVVQLLTDALGHRVFDPGRVSAIGLAVDPGLVLLNPELEVVSPREIGWAEHLAAGSSLRDSMESLAASEGRWFRRAGVIFSVLDYLRYRMTGAIATHESFIVAAGLASSPQARSEWNVEFLCELGVCRDALPPVFDATWKVGVVGPELGRTLGFGRNVWVNGGSDPLSARLFVAAEPVPNSRVLQLDETGCSSWSVGVAPPTFEESALPLPCEGAWYYPGEAETDDPRRLVNGWTPPDGEQWTIDSPIEQRLEDWHHRPNGDVWFAWDCGGPSAGVGIQAGIGLGWWRDLRGLWRKRRAPVDYEDWYNSLLKPEEDLDPGAEAV